MMWPRSSRSLGAGAALRLHVVREREPVAVAAEKCRDGVTRRVLEELTTRGGHAPSRSSARRTLPLAVFGRSSANSTMRGYLYGAVCAFT